MKREGLGILFLLLTGSFELVTIEELEKYYIALVKVEGYQDVLISSDKPLLRRLKIGHLMLKIVSAADANWHKKWHDIFFY